MATECSLIKFCELISVFNVLQTYRYSELQHLFHFTSTVNNVPFLINADVDSLQTNPSLEEGYCRALLCRLRFRKVLPHFSTLTILRLTL